MKLDHKIALVTGGGSGIGRKTAQKFAQESATVIVNDIDKNAGESTVADIITSGGKAEFFQTDVTKSDEVQSMINTIINNYSRIDVLFNNVGISETNQLHEVKEEDWDQIMNINVKGVYLTSKYVIPHMIDQNSGSVINMSSCVAEIGLAKRAAYAATKGAILALTKSMQVDYAPHNIRVNAILPGTIMTPFVDNYLQKSDDKEKTLQGIKARQLNEDLGRPEDVAEVALFLASDDSQFMMGSPVYIDGGVVFGKNA